MGIASWLLLIHNGPWMQGSDFTYPWFGARMILAGRDPYLAVKTAGLPWGPYLFYPVPTFLLAIPFTPFPAAIAGAVFFGLSCGLLAFWLIPHGHWRLLIFVSGPMIVAAGSAQWSPLLVACGLWVPALGVLVAKPNIALPLLAMQTRRTALWSAVAGGGFLLALSFILVPHWLPEWLTSIRLASKYFFYLAPIRSSLGVVLLLAALRWRTPEARLLLVMACTPQKLLFYDQLALLLIPATRRQMQAAVLASGMALAYALQYSWKTGEATMRHVPPVIIGLFWPALVMVLLRSKRSDDQSSGDPLNAAAVQRNDLAQDADQRREAGPVDTPCVAI